MPKKSFFDLSTVPGGSFTGARGQKRLPLPDLCCANQEVQSRKSSINPPPLTIGNHRETIGKQLLKPAGGWGMASGQASLRFRGPAAHQAAGRQMDAGGGGHHPGYRSTGRCGSVEVRVGRCCKMLEVLGDVGRCWKMLQDVGRCCKMLEVLGDVARCWRYWEMFEDV